jgi:predicted aspartyl protease
MPVTKRSTPLQIIDLHGDGFHPLLDIKVFGKAYKVVLDTGASRTAFDHNMLLQANPKAAVAASERLSTGLGTNSMESFTAVIENMKIGRITIPKLEVAVLDLSTINIAYAQLGHPQVLGVLGSDVLMQYNAVIDFGKKLLWLKNRN